MPLPAFHEFDDQIGDIGTVGDFWRWAMSDLLGNRHRGILAEYMVAKLLGVDLSHPRMEWDCYDLIYSGYKIDVKSSASVQSWHNTESQRSTLRFSVAPHQCWDALEDTWSYEKKRWADLYIFCVFPAEPSEDTRDVLDLRQWRFYVAATSQMESYIAPATKEIGITKVQQICGDAVKHNKLKWKIDTLIFER